MGANPITDPNSSNDGRAASESAFPDVRLPASSASQESERRQVTILFADMADYTSASERLGEDAGYQMMKPIFNLMAAAVRCEGGLVQDFTGDGIMAVFGLPAALEDATMRACRAALTIQRDLATIEADVLARYGVRPRIRIGVNEGPVVAAQIESGRSAVSGDTVNFASRLQSLAAPGGITLSEAAHRSVAGLVLTHYAGSFAVKGKREPQNVYRLDAIRPDATRFDAAVSRGLTPYVGRANERALLNEARLNAGSALELIDLAGDPGIGKSRLAHEFTKDLDRSCVLRGACSPDSVQTPFRLFIDIARDAFGLQNGDSEDGIRRKIADGLTTLGLDALESRGLLTNMVGVRVSHDALEGLDGTLVGLRTRELLLKILRQQAMRGNLVLLLEDIHWIDSASEATLTKLMSEHRDIPMLILQTRRPEYCPPWAKTGKTLHVPPLSTEETSEIVRQRLGSGAAARPVVANASEKAEGNPLFAEEIALFLSERGIGAGGGPAPVERMLPPSVQTLLAARVDALRPEDRSLLQAASVIGRSFDPELLARVVNAPGEIESRLDRMRAMDLLRPDQNSGDYVFKHALVRDALYESLLSGPRAAIHSKVADEIERRSGNRISEVVELLAHHFFNAARDDKAFLYLSMAGRKCLGVYSIEEAGHYYRQAALLHDRASNCASDDLFADFLSGFVSYLHLVYEPQLIAEAFERYRDAITRLGDRPEVVSLLHYEVWALILSWRFADAARMQARTASMANRLGDDRSRALAATGAFLLSAVDCKPVPNIVQRANAAVAAAFRAGDFNITARLRFAVAWDAFHRGHIARARTLADAMLKSGADMRDPRSASLGLWLHCWISTLSDDNEATLDYAERALATAITPHDLANARMAKASALIRLRRIGEAAPLLRSMQDEFASHGRWYSFNGNRASTGVVKILQGHFAEGVRIIESAIDDFEKGGYAPGTEWFRIVLGQIYIDMLDGGNKPDIKVLLRNAPFLVKTRFSGRRKAIRLLEKVSGNPLFGDDCFHTGTVQFHLGRCHAGARRRALAQHHFLKARQVLEPHGPSSTLDKVNRALAELSEVA